MKQMLHIVLLLLSCSVLSAQQTSIEFYPSNPTDADSVMVVMNFSFPFVNCDFGIVYNWFNTSEDRIDFYPEFCPGDLQDSTFCATSDTLILAPIEDGSYDINVYVGMTGQCPVGNAYYPLDTISTTLQISGATPISELSFESINIFPNPTDGDFVIEIEDGATYFLKVYNVLGQELSSKQLSETFNTISFHSLPKGTYFLEFESMSKQRFTKKIEVN